MFVELPEEQPDYTSFKSTIDPGPISTPRPNPNPTPNPAPVQTQTMSVRQIVEKTEGPNLDEISLTDEQAREGLAPGGIPNFDKVYANASLPKSSFGAEQALDVINSLPADLPIDVKRSTVHATLNSMGKAMGVDTDSVVADASRKMAALGAFEDSLNLQSKKFVDTMSIEISGHEAKIAELKAKIEESNKSLQNALSLCAAENDKLDDVLEFFTLDIGASKNAPPK
jgi:predicted outer membrane protein